jgi:hypothetical protein
VEGRARVTVRAEIDVSAKESSETVEAVVPVVVPGYAEEHAPAPVVSIDQHPVPGHDDSIPDFVRGCYRIRGVTPEQEDVAPRCEQQGSRSGRVGQLVGREYESRDRAADRDVVARVGDVIDPELLSEPLGHGRTGRVAPE